MPKNKANDPITDQEIAFARLVLSGGMTDRQAAVAVGLNPDSAAYTKSKPRVRAYMLEHRAAVQQQLVQQDSDLSRLPRRAVGRAVEGQHRFNLDREQVLNRLWELAKLGPEMTRGSITGQVKALSMIIAMQNFIPDRRAVNRLAISSEKKSPPALAPQIHTAAWLARHKPSTTGPQPSPARQEDSPAVPAPGAAAEAPPDPGPTQSIFASRFSPPEAPPLAPYVCGATFLPDMRVPFSIKENPLPAPAELPNPQKDPKISNFINNCRLNSLRKNSGF
jgi:hypothetical protein